MGLHMRPLRPPITSADGEHGSAAGVGQVATSWFSPRRFHVSSGEREAATQIQLLKESGRAATPTPLDTTAVPQQHPEDAHLGLFAIGGDATPLSPMSETEPWAVPSC